MKRLLSSCLALAFAAGCSSAAPSSQYGGAWKLNVSDPSGKPVATLTIRFSNSPAYSCIAGNWKLVIVEAASTVDPKFFPVADELTYQVNGSELTIGRNGVCDGYLRLQGKLDGSRVEGAYYVLGLRGGNDLGRFLLVRDR